MVVAGNENISKRTDYQANQYGDNQRPSSYPAALAVPSQRLSADRLDLVVRNNVAVGRATIAIGILGILQSGTELVIGSVIE